jgi:hypothetical protein
MKNIFWRAAVFFAVLNLAFAAWASPAHPPEQYVEGDVIVTFKPSANSAAVQQILAVHSMIVKKHFAELSRQVGKISAWFMTAAEQRQNSLRN